MHSLPVLLDPSAVHLVGHEEISTTCVLLSEDGYSDGTLFGKHRALPCMLFMDMFLTKKPFSDLCLSDSLSH